MNSKNIAFVGSAREINEDWVSAQELSPLGPLEGIECPKGVGKSVQKKVQDLMGGAIEVVEV